MIIAVRPFNGSNNGLPWGKFRIESDTSKNHKLGLVLFWS